MYKLCNINIRDSQKVYKEITKFVNVLKKNFLIKEIYLYGSFAKKEIHEGSDIDLIVVGDFKEKIFDRISNILKFTDLPVEPLVYTPQEFAHKKKSSIFIKEILKTAKKI